MELQSSICEYNFAMDDRMRDWALVIAPVAFIVYFVAQPEQFTALIQWVQQLTR